MRHTNYKKVAKNPRDTLATFARAVEKQDAPLLSNSANELAEQTNDIVDVLEDAARNSRDPERSKQLRNAADNIKKYTPKAIDVGAQSLKVMCRIGYTLSYHNCVIAWGKKCG